MGQALKNKEDKDTVIQPISPNLSLHSIFGNLAESYVNVVQKVYP